MQWNWLSLKFLLLLLCQSNEKMPSFSLVTFITTLECNICHFTVNRVNEPFVRSKMTSLFNSSFVCQVLAGEYKDKKKVIKGQVEV